MALFNMDKQRIAYLHQRYLDGELSPEEAAAWAEAVHSDEHRETIHALMHTTWNAITPETEQAMAYPQRIFKRAVAPPRTRPLWPWLGAAGLLLSASVAYWLSRGPLLPEPQVPLAKNIAPAGKPPTLSLSDGTTLVLSEAQPGIVVGETLTYLDGSDVNHGGRADTYTLRTPPGRTYRVKLPDSTNVWLNAASTLTYPSRFSEPERRVTLTGEAYFSVAKNVDKPFIVNSRDQRIEVTGTEFNVSAYPDETFTATTLLSGSVIVATQGGDPATPATVHRLSPGQQSILQQGAFRIQQVDTDQYTAWMSDRFNFNGKPLPAVMRELARWYGIKVAYKGTMPDIVFYGGAQRNNNLDMVLILLETNGINYQLTPDTTLILSKVNEWE